MPYSGPSDEDLPQSVKDMPEKVRAAWVKTFNATIKKCESDGGSDCEALAFRFANGVAKRMKEAGAMTGSTILYTQLSADALTEGKWIDGIAPVKDALDMSGQKVNIKRGDLAAYVDNTRAAILSTSTESGEIVGLPIDARGHENGDGAGWIVDASLDEERGIVRFLVKWTEIGRDLIAKGIRRFFSPSLMLEEKVALGGSLTNWPASRDKHAKLLLRPIELSKGMYELADDVSVDEKSRAVRDAFNQDFGRREAKAYADSPWPIDVFDSYVVVRDGEKLYRVNYTKDADGNITFDDKDEWVEVRQSYVEAAMNTLHDWIGRLFSNSIIKPTDTNLEQPESPSEGDEVMTVKLAELSEEDRKTLVAEVAALLKPAPADPPADPADKDGQGIPIELASLFGLDGLSDEAKAARKAELARYTAAIRQQADLEYRGELLRLEREHKIVDLAQRVTGGTEEAPRGFRVSGKELAEHMLKLDGDEAKFWSGLLETTIKDGLINFEEAGHGKKMQGTVEFPQDFAGTLQGWLEGGGKLAEFFALNADVLGDQAQYNLAAFAEKEK